MVRQNADCARLMTLPGVGAVVALSFVIETPKTFTRSRDVGAWIGLTPRRYQSGEVDYEGLSAACGHNQRRHRSHPRQIDFKEMAAPTSEAVNHRTRARSTWPLSVICTGMR